MWFAFKLVSLNHWKQLEWKSNFQWAVVICFQISIFEPLKTTCIYPVDSSSVLWFAFKLVSLNHWKQRRTQYRPERTVVICFQISIFEPLKTTERRRSLQRTALWFAFKLVSLNHWKQQNKISIDAASGCDLLSN